MILVGIFIIYECFFCCYWGFYGLVICVGEGLFFEFIVLLGLLCCGDLIFFGIGLFAVVVSGMIVVNIFVFVLKYREMLERLVMLI